MDLKELYRQLDELTFEEVNEQGVRKFGVDWIRANEALVNVLGREMDVSDRKRSPILC